MKLEPIPPDPDPGDPRLNTPDCRELLKMYQKFYADSGFSPPWTGYFILRDKMVVGTCGFVGVPNDQVAEIAYWTFREFEGQGIASFACASLIDIAKEAELNSKITAKTEPRFNASTHILEKFNFRRTGIVTDPDIGEAWFWEL